MKTNFWLVTLLSGAILLLQTGCAVLLVGGAAAGVGTYAYVKGELKATEAVPLNKVWTATQAAMKDLEFPVTTQEKDALSAHLVARTSSDKKIEINLKNISDNTTDIRIRVGTFGDETLSRLILDKIKKRY